MRIVSAPEVRATIAAHVMGDAAGDDTLGEICLHPHQREALERVERLLSEHRGALLADDVGLGKTFVALALARGAREPIVIAPAALRDVWRGAARRAGVAVRFVSVEALGRHAGSLPARDPDFVIVDEAHHLRSPSTKRFSRASAVCRGARVLLLSATPVQNSLADLRTILSLFLGERARVMEEKDLARYIVRRTERDLARVTTLGLPRVAEPEWVRSIVDVDCLDRLLALPAAVPPADGDDSGVLLTYTLVRQWSSSRAALRSALQRRLAQARAMEDALESGRFPTRAELSAWCFADGVQQLGFPELIVGAEASDVAALLDQVRLHGCAVRELLAWLETSADPDRARAEALRDVMRRHPGERVVAFSEHAETVTTLYRTLAPGARAAMLTHGGGRVAGGILSRRDVLSRFAPGASARTRASERIDLLLTTDVLSEGVDLQDASVLVHLDLSWNPARLEQRVGRLRRIGAARATVGVYLFAPPAPAERLLHIERRLRLKLGAAARSVGVAGAILPGLAMVDEEAATPREERIAAAIRSWRGEASPAAGLVASAVRAPADAALACVRSKGLVFLVAVAGDVVSDSRAAVEELIACAHGDDADVDRAAVRRARERVEGWLRRREVSDVLHLPALRVAQSRRELLHRVETISRRAARHLQPRLAPLIRAARSTATATLSAGAERVLDELARAPLADDAWLHAVGEFAALHVHDRAGGAPEVLALLLLRFSFGG
ncbi:MAG: SNF2-related protein [Gemmatimonadaceae bacterium]